MWGTSHTPFHCNILLDFDFTDMSLISNRGLTGLKGNVGPWPRYVHY